METSQKGNGSPSESLHMFYAGLKAVIAVANYWWLTVMLLTSHSTVQISCVPFQTSDEGNWVKLWGKRKIKTQDEDSVAPFCARQLAKKIVTFSSLTSQIQNSGDFISLMMEL
ncbi:hypothetical protein CapIbe_020049 [Capra ibex]